MHLLQRKHGYSLHSFRKVPMPLAPLNSKNLEVPLRKAPEGSSISSSWTRSVPTLINLEADFQLFIFEARYCLPPIVHLQPATEHRGQCNSPFLLYHRYLQIQIGVSDILTEHGSLDARQHILNIVEASLAPSPQLESSS